MRDTGARALRAIMEDLMVDLMYRLPEERKPAHYIVTPEVVEGKLDLFAQSEKMKESA
jgi:ATP-dependent Clp protease ATP-binding subunit ClpX